MSLSPKRLEAGASDLLYSLDYRFFGITFSGHDEYFQLYNYQLLIVLWPYQF
ncbi:hypothetical protein IFVP18_C130156 [Vibrio parahaemolyticus]